MPFGFLNRFGVKEKSPLSPKELQEAINEYYKIIADEIGYKGSFLHDLSKPIGMKQKLIDDTRLTELGWKYKTSLNDGVKKIYDFYKKKSTESGTQ